MNKSGGFVFADLWTSILFSGVDNDNTIYTAALLCQSMEEVQDVLTIFSFS